MKWFGYGCKCGSAANVRTDLIQAPRQECPVCKTPMVFITSWELGTPSAEATSMLNAALKKMLAGT